jgi:O-methyltransferase involved in polyketide biosynthesis
MKVQLGPVQETSLIPLYGRALDARKRRPIVDDPWAAKLVDQLDWDFRRLDGSHALSGAPIRSLAFDSWVRDAVSTRERVTVIDVGVGLNTRALRMDLPDVKSVEVDLPDVVDLRRRLLPGSPNRELREGSILDEAWMHDVASRGGSFVIVAEAVFMYFDEPTVRASFERLARAFPDAVLIFDTFGRYMLDHQDRDKALSTMQARIRWACDEVHVIERWGGFRVERTRAMLDLGDEATGRVPLARRLALRAFFAVMPKIASSYRIHQVRLPSAR